MYDYNLTQERAMRDVEDTTQEATFVANMEGETIALCRQANDLRHRCFQSEEAFYQNWEALSTLLLTFRQRLTQSAPSCFIHQNFHVYGQGSRIHESLPPVVEKNTDRIFTEAVTNAMAVSDSARVSITITANGLLLDIDQGTSRFPDSFLEDLSRKSEYVMQQLHRGITVGGLMQHWRTNILKLIGYIPPNWDTDNFVPYRGNGMSHVAGNDLFRTNFIQGTKENHTLALHTIAQLNDAIDFHDGDTRVLSRLYGPSEAPLTANRVDDFFAADILTI